MLDIVNKICGINSSFTWAFKNIPLHYGIWEKILRILMRLQYFKCIEIVINNRIAIQ